MYQPLVPAAGRCRKPLIGAYRGFEAQDPFWSQMDTARTLAHTGGITPFDSVRLLRRSCGSSIARSEPQIDGAVATKAIAH